MAAARKFFACSPDQKLYPDYDKRLETSMIAESKLFFGEVLKQGLTLRSFCTPTGAINRGSAEFYGITDAIFRTISHRVSLPAESHRSGTARSCSNPVAHLGRNPHRPSITWSSERCLASPLRRPANVDPIEPNPCFRRQHFG